MAFPVFLIPMILSFMIDLPDTIKKVEKAFSGKKGSGRAKRKMAMKVVTTSVGSAVAGKKITKKKGQEIITNAGLLVDTAVATLNAVDALKK